MANVFIKIGDFFTISSKPVEIVNSQEVADRKIRDDFNKMFGKNIFYYSDKDMYNMVNDSNEATSIVINQIARANIELNRAKHAQALFYPVAKDEVLKLKSEIFGQVVSADNYQHIQARLNRLTNKVNEESKQSHDFKNFVKKEQEIKEHLVVLEFYESIIKSNNVFRTFANQK